MSRSTAAEDRYRSGDLTFEEALVDVTGIRLDREVFVEILREVSRQSGPPVRTLSAHDARLLDDAGLTADPAAATSARLVRDIGQAELVGKSLTIEAVAEHLGVTAARIRQRLSAGTLWAFDSGHGRLLPPAQFTDRGEVPHLAKVLPVVDKGWHPLSVQALLTEPQEALIVDGEPVSLVQWLTGCAGTDSEIEQARDVIITSRWQSA